MNNASGAGDMTLATSTGAGLVLAINEYATVISIILTALGILFGVFFHYLALIDRRKQLKIDEQLIKANQNGETSMPQHTPAEKRKNKQKQVQKQKPNQKRNPKTSHKK